MSFHDRILDVVTPGRDFTKEDIFNRLWANGVLCSRDAVKDATQKLTRSKQLQYEEYPTNGATVMFYRRSDQ